jgi:hypothetical protein
MLALSLITLILAILALGVSFKVADEVMQLTVVLTALFCLFLSLVFLPWPVELLMIIAFVIMTKHSNTLIQKYLRIKDGQERVCPFPLALAITHRCAIQPTPHLLRKFGNEPQPSCLETCNHVLRKH